MKRGAVGNISKRQVECEVVEGGEKVLEEERIGVR
jgi:hypothetical protein